MAFAIIRDQYENSKTIFGVFSDVAKTTLVLPNTPNCKS